MHIQNKLCILVLRLESKLYEIYIMLCEFYSPEYTVSAKVVDLTAMYVIDKKACTKFESNVQK